MIKVRSICFLMTNSGQQQTLISAHKKQYLTLSLIRKFWLVHVKSIALNSFPQLMTWISFGSSVTRCKNENTRSQKVTKSLQSTIDHFRYSAADNVMLRTTEHFGKAQYTKMMLIWFSTFSTLTLLITFLWQMQQGEVRRCCRKKWGKRQDNNNH